MDDDHTPPRPPVTVQGSTGNHPQAGPGDSARALDAIIPLEPLSGTPINDGSETLAALRDRALDAERGLAVMVDKAEPEFRATAESLRELHHRHATAIGQMLTSRGLPLDAEGSYMGNVNAAVVTVRAFFDKIDADVMTQVRDGEQTVLKAFDVALAGPVPRDEAAALRRMRDELTALLARSRVPR